MTDTQTPNAALQGDELAATRLKAGQPVITPATERDRGIGPFKRLVQRGATVIDGKIKGLGCRSAGYWE